MSGKTEHKPILERELKEVQRQIAALEESTSSGNTDGYGICEKCGQPIHPDRLAILPDTRICIRCARSEQ
jgi:DnaK suppressor protein